MEGQPTTEQRDNVIPLFGPRSIQRINGIRLNLGHLSDQELVELEDYCKQRRDDASFDLQLIQEYRDTYRSGGDTGGGAA